MNNTKTIKGFIIFVCGAIFGILETKYYDSIFFPSSLPELICDLFALILVLIGTYMILTSVLKRKK